MVTWLEGQGNCSPVLLDQVGIDLGLEMLREPRPAVGIASHREEELPRVDAPAVIVRVEHPEGDLRDIARLDLTGFRIVVVEATDLDLQLPVIARAKVDVR